ncbi:ABC transporter permease [Acidobacteriota bacterium]
MLFNYFKTAFRNLKKHKGYAFINIAGLAIGMACCILIITFIMTELSYDKFHENRDRIYRLGLDATLGERIIYMPVNNNPTAPVLIKDYPEVVNAARIRPAGRISIVYNDNQFYQEGIFWADNSLFEVFSFKLIKGDRENPLKTAWSAVLTRSAAEKYFGDEDPIGKTVRLNTRQDVTITAIAEDVPHNSHFKFEMLVSFESLYVLNKQAMEIWLNFNNYVYILLDEKADPAELEAKFPALIEKYMGRELKALGGTMKYFLQPLTSIHLHSNLEGELEGGGNILYVYIFAAIALFILAIACVNFMNLSTARSATRAREVSIRKVVGCHRGELIRQFLGETVFYSIIALLIAMVLVLLALPYFSSISGIEMTLSTSELPWLIPTFLGLILFVGLAAGSYPALFLSAFQPASVLKGATRGGKASRRFRSILVTGQFVISIGLIIGTGVILGQTNFMKNKYPGFDKSDILFIQIRNPKVIKGMDSIKTKLKQIPGVENIGSSSTWPGGPGTNQSVFIPEGFSDNESQIMMQYFVDQDYLETMGIKIVKGRNFSTEYKTDTDEAIIINETAARNFGWDDPVGKTIRVPNDVTAEQQISWQTRTVVGVINDYHMESLRQVIRPQILFYTAGQILSIKTSGENAPVVLEQIKGLWGEVDPGFPLDYNYLEDTYDSQYQAEERLSDIFTSFTVFAIIIACLGLFGMASYSTERRTKEIGIRKVLGASTTGLVSLLSREFLKLVVFANLIAWPTIYFFMHKWLQNFAYRIGISVWHFLVPGILAVVIALLTVSYQSIRAALSNPVDALKYE